MTESFHVRIAKEELIFSAAHFITFNGNVCERLHGHNYRVAVELAGPLDENHYVFDFVALREILKTIVGALDHRVLLPTQHRLIRVEEDADEIVARFEGRRWVFPREDCVLLPVANTTAELLARFIGKQLCDSLQGQTGYVPQRVRVEVDECEGQVGAWELETVSGRR